MEGGVGSCLLRELLLTDFSGVFLAYLVFLLEPSLSFSSLLDLSEYESFMSDVSKDSLCSNT